MLSEMLVSASNPGYWFASIINDYVDRFASFRIDFGWKRHRQENGARQLPEVYLDAFYVLFSPFSGESTKT